MSDDTPQEHEYHLDRGNSQKYPAAFSPLPLQSVSNSELFDDAVYNTGYMPPTFTTTAMQFQPKTEHLGRKLHKKNSTLKSSMKKRTDSTDELLKNIIIDNSEVVSHEQSLGIPTLPPKDKLSTNL